MTLYLIDKSDTVHRIPMEAGLQAEVHLLLQNQYLDFAKDAEFTEFQGSYKAQSGELLQIQDYSIPDQISFALANATNTPILKLTATLAPKALMADIDVDGTKVVVFQKIDARQVLDPSFSLIQAKKVFKKLDDRVLTLGKSIDAAIEDNKLIFFSFSKIRSFLPVLDYYEEATKEDVDLFIAEELFVFTDEEKFTKSLTPLTRKKMKMIQDNKILENTTPKRILKQSKKYKIEIDVDENGKIIFPKNAAQCKKIISFLNEEYATSVLTKRQIRMNSKEYLPKT